ncbi:MAG: DUF1588 domain-containing protein [Myxococcales bacterium]|nr:DUF1588 domain-containing protein [Myxococcales bacterium]MCB9755051.1 DUF1588 domain-containing protein [Myxococcales bacterium]
MAIAPKRTHTRAWIASLAVTACAATGFSLGVSGCNGGGDCLTNEEFFKQEVFPMVENNCMSCHNEQGVAKHTQYILRGSEWPGFIEQNLAVIENLAKIDFDGKPYLLVKPTEDGTTHKGGVRFEKGSDEYKILEELIDRVENPETCEGNSETADEFFEGVKLMNEVETLRKATLTLTGRLPTSEELELVRDLGIDSLDPVLDVVMQEEEFSERLVEIWNDIFLTDRYLPNADALDLLSTETYPELYWYEGLPEEQQGEARYLTNVGVAREPLNLITYIVQNDIPFTEILTANYTVLTPPAARAYGLNNQSSWEDPWVLEKYTLPNVPHAGVLTSSMWLNRFPTTATNRNRHRSRITLLYFLATDILRVGERPVNADSIVTVTNPTMNAPECSGCHQTIDPIAGAFQNWDTTGAYNPLPDGWYPDMVLTGFEDEDMPATEYPSALQWIAPKIANDRRFALSMVQIMYKGLTGQDVLLQPRDPSSPTYAADIHAFDIQQQVFDGIVEKFIGSSYNLKTIVKEIVKTTYFRAENLAVVDLATMNELAEVGTAKWLTPERLHRKVEAITGYPWRDNPDSTQYLLSTNEYRIFYGGIDSDSITERIDEPNGLMWNIAFRMAQEMACWTTARDFAKDPSDRLLFPFVEPSFVPEEDNGFAVPVVNDAIRANIQYLYKHVLGEQVALNSDEVDRAYNLFISVWEDGKSGVESEAEGYPVDLPGECRAENDWWTGEPLPEARRIRADGNYTVRAWMAVMTYLLSDYKFLHE